MSERMAEARANTYPGYIGADSAMACSARFKWGSLQVTDSALEAYGLSINTNALGEADHTNTQEPQLRFRADFLIAGPQEIRHKDNPESLMLGYALHRSGVRATLGTNIDKDLAGIDMASKLITSMASDLPEDEQATFLMKRGIEIQDAVKDQLPDLFSHGFAHVTSLVIQDSFEEWATKQAARSATSAVSRASAIALVGTGIINGADWLPDGNIEASSALFSLGYIGFLALRARSEVKQAIKLAPAIASTSRHIAKTVSKQAEKDIHDLLCSHGL